MKLSNKGRYAVQAVFDLAYHADDGTAQIKEISERQRIPSRFLEQVFQDLKKAGIVRSKRGPRGGYSLDGDAATLRVGDVVRAVEGPIVLVAAPSKEPTSSERVVGEAFGELGEQLEACFDSLTIADLCSRADALGLARQPQARYVYAI